MPFSQKAKLWVIGRKAHSTSSIPVKAGRRVWVHCASLGEYEMARPILEGFRQKDAAVEIGVSFFSPSGFQHVSTDSVVDFKVYIPLDTPRKARAFVKRMDADLVVFVKYDLWLNHINSILASAIPIHLIAANFYENHLVYRWYGGLVRRALKEFEGIHLIDDSQFSSLQSHGFRNLSVGGDPKFLRVYNRRSESIPDELQWLKEYTAKGLTVIMGSSWAMEETLIHEWWRNNRTVGMRLIIVPHDIGDGHISQLRKQFPESALWSQCVLKQTCNQHVLIIDAIGILAKIYRFASLAVVGGGFGSGIHNTLEAVTFGLPVIFGPNHRKFPEAEALIRIGLGFEVTDQKTFNNAMNELCNSAQLAEKKKKAIAYVDCMAKPAESLVEQIFQSNNLDA